MRGNSNNVAFLWDESHLWGLMAYKSLRALSLPFDPIRAEDIRQGCLDRYRMLFVPGGWASNKLKALGERGIEEIREFVKRGGNYFGLCGGAGLATLDGIGLLNIKRKPTKERVPSFSGRIYVNLSEHPIFSSLQPSASGGEVTVSLQPVFHAWWPSQFVVLDRSIRVIATFGEALPDAFSSDLNVGDVDRIGNWKELEEIYGINLDPRRLINEPAVVEGKYGEGKVILSLIHFDTPDDKNGAEVLKNIWHYLGEAEGQKDRAEDLSVTDEWWQSNSLIDGVQPSALILLKEVEEIIDFGLRNLLWFWRTPVLLQWRRGVRGLEYCTLYNMLKEMSAHHQTEGEELIELLHLVQTFKIKAIRLLILERLEMQKGIINYKNSGNREVQQLRSELFGKTKHYGGLFKELIDKIDMIVFKSLEGALARLRGFEPPTLGSGGRCSIR